MRRISLFSLCILSMAVARIEATPPMVWSFETIESGDRVLGFQRFLPGPAGRALRFDGMTTHLIRPSERVPRLDDGFTVEAWVAIQTYPWTWCAIANQEQSHQTGFLFGIDPTGHFGLNLAAGGRWRESRSTTPLPLYKWNHLSATYDPKGEVRLYLNGLPAGTHQVPGRWKSAPGVDLWIGRNHTPLELTEEVRVVANVAYAFDGLVDELRIQDAPLSPQEVPHSFARLRAPEASPLAPPVLPSGPKGQGKFGAYYTRLRYSQEWENPWRVGESADVVVRFEDNPTRLVFWRGTSYVPAWVTENGIWYTNEFYENQADGMPTSAEPMADKQARYSFPRILESTPARVVVQLRYAPVSLNYELVFVDPLTGWGDWVEETYTVYPDGTCIRKIQTWSSSPTVVRGKGPGTGGFRQFHESIVINPPGTRPEDNIKSDAITLVNMRGESHTYNWEKGPPGGKATFDAETLRVLHRISDLDTETHQWLTQPAGANIHLVNLKAQFSPYVIVDPQHVAIDCYDGEILRERSIFPWWNHWPVSQQIRSNGRWAVAPDRASHSSLTHIQSWKPHAESETGLTMAMLNGLTSGKPEALVPLAKSWLNAPPVKVHGPGVDSKGYDRIEGAFVFARAGKATTMDVELLASAESPLVNPAILVRNWDGEIAAVRAVRTAVGCSGADVAGRSIGDARQSSRPALFLRKSSSTFSWPICLYSSSFSASACRRICSRPLPKTSGKPASACFFQPPTWVGWMPNICAIWAVVLCALMASTATLAFRLGG